MAASASSTPLIALDAVVLDTETTGLDPANARLIEIGALRITAGALDAQSPLQRRVNPGVRIPSAATAIHGIDDGAVKEAPAFAAIEGELAGFIGDDVVIGHSIGFDLAVLKNEYQRAGLPWKRPRSLCVRMLGEVARRDLAGYSLDQLATALGVEVSGRHSALGDAATTGAVFFALLPRLREIGIRTVAEAEQACRALDAALAAQARAGWVEPVARPDELSGAGLLGRVDTYAYRHRVADVMRTPAKFVAPDTAIGDALATLMRERISSVFVAGGAAGPPRPQDTGIVTERDILRVISERGASALATAVSAIASRPLAVVAMDAFVYEAIGRMNRLKVRHLGVEDENGRIRGALSARDLLRLRTGEAVVLDDEIEHAADVPMLALAWGRLPHVARSLLEEEVAGRGVAAVVSREVGELTRRAAVLAEARLKSEGFGDPPCPYAVAVLGSAGRGESLMAMDQDNALIFAEGEPEGEADRWFERLATHIADTLHMAGVPYCTGGVMAKNALWRGSRATWRARIADWIRRSRPQDLLSVDIFFDLRGVHGDLEIANSIWRYGFDGAEDEVEFAKLLAETAGSVARGLTLFGGLKTVNGRIDLKKAGLFGIVSLARVLAVRHHILERSTPKRLEAVASLGIGSMDELAALADAQALFLDLIVAQQVEDIERGIPATNTVAVKRLTRADRERLHAALRNVRNLDELTRSLLFRS